MLSEALLNQLSNWHKEKEHGKIQEAILEIPEQERSNELICLYARALFNEDDYNGAIKALDSISGIYSDNPYFCFRYGFALYNLHREDEALGWFKQANEKGLEEIDETPGTFFPKSVAKWIERAENWAPRRIEKRVFEAGRRASRNTCAKETGLSDFDYEGFWADYEYSFEKYVGCVPTETDIQQTETTLGFRLPKSYKDLIKQRNGGLLTKCIFMNPMQRDWWPNSFSVESIYGIDSDKPYSLCGKMGSRFWIDEWGYPDLGVAICGTMSGGHDMIFLDYSDCGSKGEPCVVHIDQESNYEITYLADCFDDFVRGLVPMSEDDE